MTTTRKVLTTRAVTQDNIVEMTNREIVPVLRQVVRGPVISGSRSGATVATLTALLSLLSDAGIITDQTTP